MDKDTKGRDGGLLLFCSIKMMRGLCDDVG